MKPASLRPLINIGPRYNYNQYVGPIAGHTTFPLLPKQFTLETSKISFKGKTKKCHWQLVLAHFVKCNYNLYFWHINSDTLKLSETLNYTFSTFLSPRSKALTASFRALTTSAGLFCDFPNRGIFPNLQVRKQGTCSWQCIYMHAHIDPTNCTLQIKEQQIWRSKLGLIKAMHYYRTRLRYKSLQTFTTRIVTGKFRANKLCGLITRTGS